MSQPPIHPFFFVLGFIVAVGALVAYGHFARARRLKRREGFIRRYRFPDALRTKVAAQYPQLTSAQLTLVFDALRDYFVLCARRPNQMVGMPSRVVDVAWHEFILMTKNYTDFCQQAFGRYLHHHPASEMGANGAAATQRAWDGAAGLGLVGGALAGAAAVPLLFAIDHQLHISDGIRYSDDELAKLRQRQSETGSTCGSGACSGSSSGCPDGSSGCSDSGGCGGGCGGGGD